MTLPRWVVLIFSNKVENGFLVVEKFGKDEICWCIRSIP